MKKRIASIPATIVAAVLFMFGMFGVANSAAAVSQGTINGTFQSIWSYCNSIQCGLVVSTSVRTYYVPLNTLVWYCDSFGVPTKTRISSSGVVKKLNGAHVTINYGTDWENFVRCNA